MHSDQIRKLFSQINVWKRGDERAPHKPLLLLYALAKCSRGESREIHYREVERDLRKLLIEFGPSRKSYHTEYPFWRLQNDGLWELQGAISLKSRQRNTDIKKSELLKSNVLGGFTESIYNELRRNPRLLFSIINEILDDNFPASIHEDILSAVGLDPAVESKYEMVSYRRKKRDPMFRGKVLIAYEYRCSVCRFDLRIGTNSVGLEAAHIKWHQAGGPDSESNGLALCSIHHKLFDRGAFTLLDNFILLVSEQVNGEIGIEEWLLRFHGKEIGLPQRPSYSPKVEYLSWHRKEVFHLPPRYPYTNFS